MLGSSYQLEGWPSQLAGTGSSAVRRWLAVTKMIERTAIQPISKVTAARMTTVQTAPSAIPDRVSQWMP
ncbi:hypothetical protein [Kribbella sp. NPDC051620]|uniref:hypothetical protein n=1 Tax=Kribbella sp. NPDC051620 TaxID=3364120 RepID=UPI003797BB39